METVTQILNGKWRPFDELPNIGYSFAMLIQFEQHGLHGEDNKHISTGVYWHLTNTFSVADKEMKNFTPSKFIPLYENI
jgi:hypothetical protein